jgi:hypothetical protein
MNLTRILLIMLATVTDNARRHRYWHGGDNFV